MLWRLFFSVYNRAFESVFSKVLTGLVGLIFLALFIPVLIPPQMKCSRESRREELQNSVIFLRMQAAYYQENGEFAKDFDRLGMVTLTGTQPAETKYHHYHIYSLKRDVRRQRDRETVILTAQPKDAKWKTAIAYAVIPDRIALDSSDRKQLSIAFTRLYVAAIDLMSQFLEISALSALKQSAHLDTRASSRGNS